MRTTIQHSVKAPTNNNKLGFALIATISVMVLLVLVALAMLSLSVIETRSSRNSQSMTEARANARLALMLALGDLQKQMGPDQRISANAAIRDSNSAGTTATSATSGNNHWLGVWNARTEHPSAAPDYDKVDSFRRWLVSAPEQTDAEQPDFATSAGGDMVTLVGGRDESIVRAPTITTDNGGKIAWWVGDENTKAMINVDESSDRLDSLANVLASSGLPGAKGFKSLEVFNGVDDLPYGKTPTQSSFEILPGVTGIVPVRDMFHDVTAQAYSLPVDVVNGRLKKDFNLLLGRDQLPAEMQSTTIGNRDGMPSWKFLHSFYQWPERVEFASSGRPTINSYSLSDPYDPVTNPNRWDGESVQRIAPILVKQMLVYSYGTERVTVTDQDDEKRLALRLYNYPIVVLWNPYNVDLEVKEYMNMTEALPVEIDMSYSDAGTDQEFRINANGWGGRSQAVSFGPDMPGSVEPIIIKAGHVKALYPVKGAYVRTPRFKYHYYTAIKDTGIYNYSPDDPGTPFGRLRGALENYNPEGENSVSSGNEILGDSSDTLEMEIRLSENPDFFAFASTWSIRSLNSDWYDNNGPGADSMTARREYGHSGNIGFKVTSQSPVVSLISGQDVPSRTFGELEDNPTPFLVATTYLKPCDDDLFPSKTWVNSSPTHGYKSVTDPGWTNSDAYTPWYAAPYTMRIRSVASDIEVAEHLQLHPTDDRLVYFGSSNDPAKGRFIIPAQQVPITPLMSLGQLQHLPSGLPYSTGTENELAEQFLSPQALGNSFANPGIPAGKRSQQGWWHWIIAEDVDINALKNSGWSSERIDRSYIGNQALWDSWYFSSLAALNHGPLAAEGKSLDRVIEDFFQGKAPNLRMKFYQPSGENKSDIKQSLVDNDKPDAEAYLKAAKYCMIQGGFNVNSTSVSAWKAVLASTHKKRLAYLDPKESSGLKLTEENTYPVSRALVPLGTAADQQTGGNSIEEMRWRGYRDLTEEQLEELAEAIVKQVQKRGPFRSLSEFVNRRLSADDSDERALSGALQAALDDTDVSINKDYRGPGNDLQSADFGSARFNFPKAAEGSRYQGAPCYVTQADLLQNLAPVISVRGDSFVIRAYGDARDSSGRVLARAWCEATVQRHIEYVDTANEPELEYTSLNEANQRFGRRFKITGFRWISPAEIN